MGQARAGLVLVILGLAPALVAGAGEGSSGTPAGDPSPIELAYSLYRTAAMGASSEACARRSRDPQLASRWREVSRRFARVGEAVARDLDTAHGDADHWFFATYVLLSRALRDEGDELGREFRAGVLRVGCRSEHLAQFEASLQAVPPTVPGKPRR